MTKELSDFDWDDNNTFFGVESEVVKPIQKEEQKKEQKEEEVSKKEDVKSSIEETEDPFSFFNEDNDDVLEEKVNSVPKNANTYVDDSESTKEFYTSLHTDLKETGAFILDLEEDEVLTEETFPEHVIKEVDHRVEQAIDDFMENIDERGKNYLRFLKEGGSSNDFFNNVEREISPKKDKNFLKKYLEKYENLSSEEISDKIEYWSDKGKLEDKIDFYKRKEDKMIQQRETQLIKEQEKIRNANRKKHEDFKNSFNSNLTDIGDYNGLPITKKDKKELSNYVFKAAVKTNNGYLTGFQQDLAKAFEDPEKLIAMAKLLKSDFDFSSLEMKKQTQATKKAKSKIHETKTGRVKSRNTSLADRF